MSASLFGTAEPRIHPPITGTSVRQRWRNPILYFAAALNGFFLMGVELLGKHRWRPTSAA